VRREELAAALAMVEGQAVREEGWARRRKASTQCQAQKPRHTHLGEYIWRGRRCNRMEQSGQVRSHAARKRSVR